VPPLLKKMKRFPGRTIFIDQGAHDPLKTVSTCRGILMLRAFQILVGILLALFLVPSHSIAKGRVVPPVEWTWLPEWSHDGNFIAVQWPAPNRVLPGGKVQQIAPVKGSAKSSPKAVFYPMPSTVKATADGTVGLISNFDDRKTLILDSKSFECSPVSLNYMVHDLAWSPNDKYIAGMANHSFGAVFDSKTGAIVLNVPDNAPGFMQGFVWAPDSNRIVICHTTGAHVWDVALGRETYTVPDIKGYGYASITWSPDGSSIAAYGSNEKQSFARTSLRVCEANSGKLRFSVDSKTGITGALWSSDGKWFVYGDQDIHFLDPHSLKEVYKIDANKVLQVLPCPDGKRLIYRDQDSLLHVFDMQAMRETAKISAEKTGLFRVKWSPNGSYLMIEDAHNRIAICDARDGHYLGYKQFGDSLTEWSPDSKAIVMYLMQTESVQFTPVTFAATTIAFEGGSPGNPWENERVLRNLDDCFDELNRLLPPKAVEEIKNTKEKDLCMYTGGPSLGMQLRNTWGLRGSTPLVTYFNSLGITDGAAMSTIIIESYWRHLNSKTVELEKQVEREKFYADCEAPIAKENKQLPPEVSKFEAKGKDGKLLSIDAMPKGTKIVSFALTSYGPSDSLLHCLREIRKKYPADQVSMMLFAFKPETPEKKEQAADSQNGDHDYDCTKSIAKSLDECHASIPWAYGSPELRKALVKFARGRVTMMCDGLPQALIINKNGLVTTRFNGWNFGDDIDEFRKSVDEALKNP
jgi:WD40 repeat protein